MKSKSFFSIVDGDTLFCPIVDAFDNSPITSYRLRYSDQCQTKMAAANEMFGRLSEMNIETDEDFEEVEDDLVHFLSYELQPTLPKEVQWDFQGTLEGGYKEVAEWVGQVLSELSSETTV